MSETNEQVLVRAFGQTDVGMKRTNNEDAFVIADLTAGKHGLAETAIEYHLGERGILVAVSDGMGGSQAGEVASSLVIDSLRGSLDEQHAENAFEGAIKDAVERANKEVWNAASEAGQQGMGATLTGVLIHGAMAHIVQVGDSRAYLIRSNRIRQVTKDQSYVEVLISAGVLTREEAEKSPYKNVILQAMGVKPEVNVTIGRLELRQGDLFLVCSDGLWGKVTDDEMLNIVLESGGFKAACGRMIDLAKERGGDDNITVALAEVRGASLEDPHEGETVTRMLQPVDFSKLKEGT